MLVLVLGGTAAGAVERRPALAIVDVKPLTVRGSSFRPRERVTLLVVAGKPLTTHARAGAGGGFRVSFPVRVEGCMAVHVQAIGARGSRAATGIDVAGCDERD